MMQEISENEKLRQIIKEKLSNVCKHLLVKVDDKNQVKGEKKMLVCKICDKIIKPIDINNRVLNFVDPNAKPNDLPDTDQKSEVGFGKKKEVGFGQQNEYKNFSNQNQI